MPVGNKRKPKKGLKPQTTRQGYEDEARSLRIIEATRDMERAEALSTIASVFAKRIKGYESLIGDILSVREDRKTLAMTPLPVETWGVRPLPVGTVTLMKVNLATVLYASMHGRTFVDTVSVCGIGLDEPLVIGVQGETLASTLAEAVVWHYGEMLKVRAFLPPGEFDKDFPGFDEEARDMFTALFSDKPDWCGPVRLTHKPIFASEGDPLAAAKLSGNRIAEDVIRGGLSRGEAKEIADVMPETAPVDAGGKRTAWRRGP